jgi:hypothetical protein
MGCGDLRPPRLAQQPETAATGRLGWTARARWIGPGGSGHWDGAGWLGKMPPTERVIFPWGKTPNITHRGYDITICA